MAVGTERACQYKTDAAIINPLKINEQLKKKRQTPDSEDLVQKMNLKYLISNLEKEMAVHSSVLAWRIPWT